MPILDATNCSKQQLIQEFLKCKNDPHYFIDNYVQLEAPGGNINMKMYVPQENCLNMLIKDHYVVVLKSRQTGISTIVQAFVVFAVTFFKNVVVGVVSKDSAESTSFCKSIISMIESLPDWMRPKFKKCTEQSFILFSGCKFFASQINMSNPAKLFRGKAITIAIIDEAAHTEKIEDAFSGFGPALIKSQTTAMKRGIPFGTFIISTPNKTQGIGKWYYDTWVQSNAGENIYKPFVIHWKDVPEFANDPEWYKKQCAILKNDPILISQELEMKFLASKNSFLPPETIEKLNDVAIEPISKITMYGFDILQWQQPNMNRMYLIGVDTATSSGGDKSAIVVLDYISFEQVAEYTGKLRVDEFCDVVEVVSKVYPRHLLIVENNSVGNQVVEYVTRKKASFNVYTQKVKSDTVGADVKYKWGLSTNAHTRPLIIDSLYTYIRENPNLVKSKNLALELIGLERSEKNDRIEAAKGSHDDTAIALGFCSYVRMYDPPLSLIAESHEEIIEDFNEIIDMNAESAEVFSFDLSKEKNKSESGVVFDGDFNRALSKHIKKNLHTLVKDQGSNIDISKMIGMNIDIIRK